MIPREAVAGSRHAIIVALFLVCAVVLGGGGSPNPGTELLLQMVFVVAALAWLWIPAPHGLSPFPRALSVWLVCVLVLALPLAQLVPLPPEVWAGLPGQENRVAALALVGREQSWQPLSQSPPRTFAALLAMIPALFAFAATASLDARGRRWVVAAIALMALVTALLGALQVSLGVMSAPYLYSHNSPTLTGFQANRNAAADVLLIGIAASAALLTPSLAAGEPERGGGRHAPLLGSRRGAFIALAGAVAVLFFAVLLTASRMGIALLAVTLLGVWVMLLPALADRGPLRFVPAALAGLVALGAAVAWQAGNTALGSVAARFVLEDEVRRELWRDGWFAMSQAWPFGVGLGGAQPAMITAERLEVLEPALPNRVHNDYLELALEGGLPALLVLVLVAAVLAAAAWRSWWRRPQERHLTALGIVILLIAAAHSFVDYPLRSMALACLIGTGAGLLISSPRRLRENEPSE